MDLDEARETQTRIMLNNAKDSLYKHIKISQKAILH